MNHSYVILPVTYTDEEAERAYEEFYEDVHTEFLKFGEIINFKVCRNGSSHLRGNIYVHYKSLDSAVMSYQSVNGRYFAGKQLQCEFVGITRWRVAICGEFMKSKLTTCSRGTTCNFIHCFRNPGGDYEWADWDKPPPKYWVKEMTALFGCSDESVHKKTEQGSPRSNSYCSARSLSRKTDFSSSSRNYSDDDSRRSESRRHSRGSDRKHSEKLDYEQHGDISNSREKQHSKSASIDHDSYRYWSDMDRVRQSYSSNLSPVCGKRKLEPRGGRGDETHHKTDPDENMHENDLDHERSRRTRRDREKQGHRAGSKGDGRIEDEQGPSNQSGTAKGRGPQKKMSTSRADEWNSRGTTTYNSDCSDGERQSPHIYREEESPRSDICEEFEDRKKRRRTHKLKNSSNWDHSDRGNGEVEQGSENLRDSRQNYTTSECSSKYYYRKDRQRAESSESERQICVQHEKSERKRGTSDIEVTRLHATDHRIDVERDRWEPDGGGSA